MFGLLQILSCDLLAHRKDRQVSFYHDMDAVCFTHGTFCFILMCQVCCYIK